MRDADEENVLDFTLENALCLTGSKQGFLFLPGMADLASICRTHGDCSKACSFPSTGKFPPEVPCSLPAGSDAFPPCAAARADSNDPAYGLDHPNIPMVRGTVARVCEQGKTVILLGLCGKETKYTKEDLINLETVLNGAWLVLRRRRQQVELQHVKDAIKEAGRVKSEFLANISQELRAPLNGILGMLQMMNLSPMPPSQRRYLQTARYSGETLLGIISDMLDFARMETGHLTLNPAPFNLGEAARSTLRLYAPQAQAKNVALLLYLDPAIPGWLMGDAARVRQIMANLMSNAVKFTESGRVTLDCELISGGDDKTALVRILVNDTGVGIPKIKQTEIFDAFAHANASSTRKHPGTGLGLCIVRSLVSLMGGKVEVESEEGKGAVVRCVIPFTEADMEALAAARRPEEKPSSNEAMDILVAEDDSVGRLTILSFLRHAGHRAVCVNDGRQALEALQLHPFDCLFTDIQMPGMDGLELTRHIRQGALWDFPPTEETRALLRKSLPNLNGRIHEPNPDMPIVAVSSRVGDEFSFLRQGIDHYLSKPIVLEELKDVLQQVGR